MKKTLRISQCFICEKFLLEGALQACEIRATELDYLHHKSANGWVEQGICPACVAKILERSGDPGGMS